MKLIFVHGGPGLNSNPEKNLLREDFLSMGLEPIFWNEPKKFKTKDCFQEILDDLRNLILKQDEKVCLVGHSSGCKNILNILPDVKHLASHICFISPALDLVKGATDIINFSQTILEHKNPEVFAQIESLKERLTDDFDQNKQKALMLAFSSNYAVHNFKDEASFKEYFSYMTGEYEFNVQTYVDVNKSMPSEITKSNEQFDIPMLALLGEDDPIFDVDESKNLLSFYFNNEKIVQLKDTSHYPHIDAKDRFFKELRSFLF